MTDDDAKIAALLEAERRLPAVGDAVKQRIRAQVRHTIAGGGSGPSGDAPPDGGGAAARAAGGLGAKGALAAAFALGVVVGGVAVGTVVSQPPPVPLAVATALPAPSMVANVPAAPAEPAPEPSAEEAPRGAAPSAAPRPASAPADEGAQDRDLGAERALLAIARTAVGRRDASAALAALQQHKQRFPKGRLSEERESLWVQALLLSGDAEAARARSKRFQTEYPGSMLGRSLDKALADGGVTP